MARKGITMRRYVAIGGIAALLSISACAVGSSDSVETCENQTLNVARSSSASLIYAVDYVAEAQGFFEDEKVDVKAKALGGGSEALQALIGGSVDVTTTAYFSMLESRAKGASLVAFASEGNRNTSEIGFKKDLAPPSDADPETVVKALKGLTVGVTSPGSSTDQTLRFLVKKYGMDPDTDLKITAVGSADSIVAGFSQGSLDAYLIGPPNSGIAANQGDGEIALNIAGGSVESLNDMLYMVASTTEEVAESKGALLQCYSDALNKATQFVNSNPDEARDSIRSYFEGLSDNDFDQAWDSIVDSIPESSDIIQQEAERASEFVEVVNGEPVEGIEESITTEFNTDVS